MTAVVVVDQVFAAVASVAEAVVEVVAAAVLM